MREDTFRGGGKENPTKIRISPSPKGFLSRSSMVDACVNSTSPHPLSAFFGSYEFKGVYYVAMRLNHAPRPLTNRNGRGFYVFEHVPQRKGGFNVFLCAHSPVCTSKTACRSAPRGHTRFAAGKGTESRTATSAAKCSLRSQPLRGSGMPAL